MTAQQITRLAEIKAIIDNTKAVTQWHMTVTQSATEMATLHSTSKTKRGSSRP